MSLLAQYRKLADEVRYRKEDEPFEHLLEKLDELWLLMNEDERCIVRVELAKQSLGLNR